MADSDSRLFVVINMKSDIGCEACPVPGANRHPVQTFTGYLSNAKRICNYISRQDLIKQFLTIFRYLKKII